MPKRLTDNERLLREIPEKAFMEQIREEARLAGWLVYHTHDSRRSEKGFPDLVLVKDGRLLFIETKTETGRVTFEQQTWMEELNKVTGTIAALVVRPRDWNLIHEELL